VRRFVPLAASALATLFGAFTASACGGGKQHRPDVVSTFPANLQVVPGWVPYIRVTYDERVHVLNLRAARVESQGPLGGTQSIRVEADPTDDHSILILPDLSGHFLPNERHIVAVQEGAAANDDGHYRLDEYKFEFTTGAAPDLFLAATDGNVYQFDPDTGTTVFGTSPGAGWSARSPASTDGRIWVWRDPVPGPGSSVLSTFTPGTPTITQDVTLTGETGVVHGGGIAVSEDGRIVYATAEDAGTNRLFVHRIDAATQTETGSLMLSTPLDGHASFRPAFDRDRDRLFVVIADGLGGGSLCVVDLDDFEEVDMVAGGGVDALPVPGGAGACIYDTANEWIWILAEQSPTAKFVLVNGTTFAQYPTSEPFVGQPRAGAVTPDGHFFLQGLDGYPDDEGIVRSRTDEVDEGFAFVVSDDVGGVDQGCDRIRAIVRDPTTVRFDVFPDDGVGSFYSSFDTQDVEFVQVDFDAGTEGIQVIPLGYSVTGAVRLFGVVPP
jgi:hypothetical protein